MNDDDAELLSALAVGSKPMTFIVRGPDPAEIREHPLPRSFAVIGRGPSCDVRLTSEAISFRHAYVQTIGVRVFCVDLASRAGLRWQDEMRTSGWLSGDRSVHIGPYTIELPAAGERAASEEASSDNPLEQFRSDAESYPRVRLEFLNRSLGHPAWTVNRLITLVGRNPQCKVRLDGKNVSAVHCSLLLTPRGLWVIDLLGRGGTRVNGEQVRCARVADHHRLEIGSYQIRVRVEGDAPQADPSAGPAAGAPAPPDFAQTPAPPATPKLASSVADSFGYESLMHVRREPGVMIISPRVEGGAFRYAQLRTACNAVRRLLDEPDVRNLVINLAELNYFGAEFVGVLITLARNVTNTGGQVAFCGAGQELQDVLQNMNLFGLWPHYASVDEALAALQNDTA